MLSSHTGMKVLLLLLAHQQVKWDLGRVPPLAPGLSLHISMVEGPLQDRFYWKHFGVGILINRPTTG